MNDTAIKTHSILDTHTSHIPHVTSGAYPLREGNLVRPLVDGEPAFRRICEAVEAAEHSVWITVAFLILDFQMPDGRGTFFDVLDKAQARGLDVRVIFWRGPDGIESLADVHFPGTSEHRDFLTLRGSSFLARWDRGQKTYCQHQKSWLVDAGRDGEVAFVGGINLDEGSLVAPGHDDGAGLSVHDVYVEIKGPSATDVHHNFVQRWNETSEKDEPDGVWPHKDAQSDLTFPQTSSPAAGKSVVQIQRTVRRGHYTDETATPGGVPHDISDGDYSIIDQYLKAIAAAKHTIYFEDQAIGAVNIIEALHEALARGVEVVFLVPGDPYEDMMSGRSNPKARLFYERLGALGDYANFILTGIASQSEQDGRQVFRNIYVHAKICLVDDHWATIGSTNIGNRSFFGDTELNATFWDDDVVKALRAELLTEHLSVDTSALDDRAAFGLYKEIAEANTKRRAAGAAMKGLAFALDPRTYGS